MHFIRLPGTRDGARQLFQHDDKPLILVSRHGLGDNVFFSPCFERLHALFPKVYFCSSVNAYTTIFHASQLVSPLYCGGVNGNHLQLSSLDGFVEHFKRLGLDLGYPEAVVYHYGLFEPHLPYSHESAFVKGRRNLIELFDQGPAADESPRYHVAADPAPKAYIEAVLGRWFPERPLVVVARYGHTDGGKNFGHDYRDTLELVQLLNFRHPDRLRFLSFDYTPGEHASDGCALNLRSMYGFLPCDAASMWHVLNAATILVTVPSGPMLVGATIPTLKMLTLWKTMSAFHFLDPQFEDRNPVHALVADERLIQADFMKEWPTPAQEAVRRRWRINVAPITPVFVARTVSTLLEDIL